MGAVEFTAQRGLKLLGDENGAWMADTTAETLVGSELKTDDSSQSGTITGATSPWDSIEVSAQYSIASSVITAACSTWETIRMVITLTDGDEYLMAITVTAYTSGSLSAYVGSTVKVISVTGTGVYFVTIAAGSADNVWFASSDFNGSFTVDTVRLAVPDLSSNESGLGVYGSVIKTAVATGADLVGYSDFSASNYIEQPYNPDLDSGTSGFCFEGWARTSATAANNLYFRRGYYSGGWSGALIDCYISSAGAIICRISDDGLATFDDVNYAGMDDNEWRHYAFMNDATSIYLYVDGALVDSATITNAAGSLSNADATLIFGVDQNGGNAATLTDLSLWKSSPARTAAQIKTVYNSEKHLFKKHSYYTQAGESYSLDLPQKTPRPSGSTQKNDTLTLSGKRRSIIHHEVNEWEIATSLIHRTDGTDYPRKSEFAELMYSTRGSEEFEYDPYGSVASPDDPLTVLRVSNQYDLAPEENTNLFRSGFRVREVE